MATLRLIFGDQLSHFIPALADIERDDIVLMIEAAQEATYVRHHKQKIVMILSAMRHFAQELRDRGVKVDYVKLDDPDNTGTFAGEAQRAIARHGAQRLIVTHPGEWRVLQDMQNWQALFGVRVDIRDDTRFVCPLNWFRLWAGGRKSLRMEFFYREMRRRTKLLMNDDEPAGGQWNFDASNRKPMPASLTPPKRRNYPIDATTADVISLVNERFASHFGTLEHFNWPVTRAQALEALEDFANHALPQFGDYQDAMRRGDDFAFHSLLSPALNTGLLDPLEVCEAAQEAWRKGLAPLNAVEGFIRQIIGWREYVRGVYWLKMPDYQKTNALEAHRELPGFYWGAKTGMRCISETVASVSRNAYAHHIQRLMVTGNFALLAGIEPAQVEEWYLAVFADAFEWVELPNTHGMALFADGGYLASKPYAASGAYINRMSDYCGSCGFDVKKRTGDKACPFNFLYWNFLLTHKKRFAANPRMALAVKNAARLDAAERRAITRQAQAFLDAPDAFANQQDEWLF